MTGPGLRGKQDPGESLAETAIREIREEVGRRLFWACPGGNRLSGWVAVRRMFSIGLLNFARRVPVPWRMRVKWMSCAG